MKSIRPDELISSLPTDIHLILGFDFGRKSNTIGRSFSLFDEESTPSGLLSIKSFISDSMKDKVFPSYSTTSSLFTELPSFAIFPLTKTLFDFISCSQLLLDPNPDLQEIFEVFLTWIRQLEIKSHLLNHLLFQVVQEDLKYFLNSSHLKNLLL